MDLGHDDGNYTFGKVWFSYRRGLILIVKMAASGGKFTRFSEKRDHQVVYNTFSMS